MNLSVEHVLMFVLVFCAFYYMMNRCGCKEGIKDKCPLDCISSDIYIKVRNACVEEKRDLKDELIDCESRVAGKNMYKIDATAGECAQFVIPVEDVEFMEQSYDPITNEALGLTEGTCYSQGYRHFVRINNDQVLPRVGKTEASWYRLGNPSTE